MSTRSKLKVPARLIRGRQRFDKFRKTYKGYRRLPDVAVVGGGQTGPELLHQLYVTYSGKTRSGACSKTCTNSVPLETFAVCCSHLVGISGN